MAENDYYLQPTDIDDIDRQILQALADNSRTPASALANLVGLTRQAVSERMDGLQANGIVRQYTLSVDADRVGLLVRAFVAITLRPACSAEAEREVIELLRRNPWVMECYRVTGDDYFQVRVVAPAIEAIKELVLDLRASGVVQGTRTMLALETLFEKAPSALAATLGTRKGSTRATQTESEIAKALTFP